MGLLRCFLDSSDLFLHADLMQDYGYSAWLYLGSQIKTARKQAGLRNSKMWADRVGRSTRVLLGLERGERVGDDTLELVETALGWTLGRCEEILAGQPHRPDLDLADPDRARGLSVVPGILDEPEPTEDEDNEVLAAVLRDPFLDEDAKAHYVNQYELLREMSARRRAAQSDTTEMLPYVAHGKRETPVDPEEEKRLEDIARAARARNQPKPPKKVPPK